MLNRPRLVGTRRVRLGPLTAVNAALYVVAAVLHLGVKIPLGPVTLGFPEPIPAATVVEAFIGAGLAAAAAVLLMRGRPARRWAWSAYGFASLGTIFGLTIALLRRLEGPDIWVHYAMLAGLAGGSWSRRRSSPARAVRDGRDRSSASTTDAAGKGSDGVRGQSSGYPCGSAIRSRCSLSSKDG
jgi:hypothetical protein